MTLDELTKAHQDVQDGVLECCEVEVILEEDDSESEELTEAKSDLSEALDHLKSFLDVTSEFRSGKSLTRREAKKLHELSIEVDGFLNQWNWEDD